MDDLCFFYSAKMAIVFILMLLSATLEAQNEKDKFFDLMTAIGEHFGGEFNEAEKALELDLNGVNSFLEGLNTFAIREIVRKNENGEFECKESKKPDFKMAIQTILGQNVRNLLKAIIVPQPIKTILDKKLDKKVEELLKALFAPKKSDEMPSGSDQIPSGSDQIPSGSDQIPSGSDQIRSGSVDSVKFTEEKLFNLLFSLATRLEALVYGKNRDGTLKEKKENSKEKIQIFLAVPKCIPKWESNIFDYWIEIIKIKTKNSHEPIFGVAIYKEKYSGYSKLVAFRLSRENYKILKQLNDQKFSIYESLNLLRATFNQAYTTINYGDEESNREYAAQLGKQKYILSGKIRQIFVNLFDQIISVFHFNWEINEYLDKNKKCVYAMFFQNISENLIKMMSDKGIDPELHLDSEDKEIREKVQKDVEESCKIENEEAKIIFLNNVHYELAINFEFNQRKEIHDRAEGLLSDWIGDYWPVSSVNLLKLSDESYLKENASKMLRKIDHFTKNTNREAISIIEALIGKEHFKQFNLGSLFDEIEQLVEVAEKEYDKFWTAKKEINSEQLEKDIEFLKKNPESIAEEKYQKVVAIICTIKQFDEKVKMLTPKIKNIKIQERLKKLSSAIQNNEMKYFTLKLWEQMEESCNQLKHKKIEMEEENSVSEEILVDLLFELDEQIKSIEGGLKGIEEYYLKIPLMQLKEQARTLAKTFGKMLKNVKENYAKKRKHHMMEI